MPVFAQQKTANVVSHMSKVINYQKAFESTSSIESALASSNQEQVASSSQSSVAQSSSRQLVEKTNPKMSTAQITPRAESHSTLSLDKDSAAIDELITLTVTPTPVGTETDTKLMASTLKIPSFLSYQKDATNTANGVTISSLIEISNPDANGVLTISPLKNGASTNYFRNRPFKIVFKVIEDGDGTLQLVDKASPTVVNSNKVSVTGASIKGDEFADGITWNQPTNVTKVGFTEFAQNSSAGLKYGLGNLQDPEDPTIDTGMNQKLDVHGPGQMNIAIKEPNDNLIKMYFGGLNHAPDQIERTSMGFGVVFDSSMTGGGAELRASSASLSILANQLKHKKYFTGTDSNGHLVMKEMGYFNRIDLTDPNKIHKLLVEILLRPSTTGPATVQQEMFIKNISGKPDSMGVMLGQDTMLGEQGSDDLVPIKSIGNDQGLYIESKDQNYKLLVKMDTPNGPSDFSAAVGAPVFFYNWLGGFGGTFAGQGDKAKGNTKKANSTLLKDEDTGYVSKWDWMTLQNNEIQHFRNDVVGIYGPVVTPISKKNFVNLTHPAGPNKVGDKIKYELQTTNSGFKDSWQNVTFTDSVPETLKVDDSTIELTIDDYISAADAAAGKGTEGETKIYTAKVPASAYDATNHKLTVKIGDLKDDKGKSIPADLGDNDSAHITFESQILKAASNSKVKNHFDVTGTDAKNTDSNGDPLVVKDGADNEFEVEEDLTPEPDFAMTKQVRNVTKNEIDFKNTTAAAPADKVQYQIEATADATEELKDAVIKDALDADLSADKVQVQYQNADGTWGALTTVTFDSDGKLTLTNPVLANKKVRILIDATVSATTQKTKIDNQAQLVGGSYNITGDNTKSNVAELTITAKSGILKDSMHQYIKNITPKADGTTKDTADDLEETTGVKNDQIQYTFTGQADTANTKALEDVAIRHIQMSSATGLTYVPGSLVITVEDGSAGIDDADLQTGNDRSVGVTDSLASGKQFTVKYSMKVAEEQTQTITNDGWLTANTLDGSVAIPGTTSEKGIQFNQTKLVVSSKHAVKDDIKQTIFNTTTQAISTDNGTKTAGKMDDVIEYKFTATADPANTSDLINVALKNIAMTTKVGTNTEGPLAAGDMTLVTAPTLSLTVQNGATETLGVVSDFNQGKVNIGDVHQGDTMTVTYLMKVGTNVPQVITNNGDLTADNLTTKAFNATELTIGKQNNTATLEQSIRNKSVTTDDWHAPTTAKQTVETNGKPGDIIGYRFDIVANDANDGDLLNVKIQDIIMHAENQLGFKTGSLKLWINGEPTTAPSAANFPNEVKITDRLAPKVGESKVWARIDYDMTVKADAVQQDVTNDGQASASNLTTSPISANQSILHIKNKRAVKLEQTLKNETTEDTSTSTDPDYPDADGYRKTTKGIKDDIIDYRFKVKADADNSVDITGLNIHNIVMNKAGQLAQIPANNKPYTLNVEILKADGTHYTTDTGAKFNATFDKITLTKPLQPGQTAVIIYKMKVTADITDTTPALDKVVKNNGQLSAANLTDTNGVAVAQTPFNQTVLNLENGTSMMTIQYVDLDVLEGQGLWGMPILAKVAEPVQVKGSIGQKLSDVRPGERLAPKVVNASNSTDGGKYTVISFTSQSSKAQDLEHATWSAAYKDDPEFGNEDTVITYGYKKRMIGIEAPKYWDFGNYNRTQSDQTYYLDPKGTPQKVTVTDNYGVHDWSLQVSQPRQFTDDRKQELKDAQLRFQHGNVSQDTVAAGEEDAKNHGKLTLDSVPKFDLIPGSSTATTLMSFAKKGPYQKDDITEDTSNKDNRYDNPGIGVWHYNFGDKKTAGSSIGLHVPATTKRDNTTYQAVLEWSMAVAP